MYLISKERLEEYLNGTVLRTANFADGYRDNIILGLYGEAGEVCDDIKKYHFHGSLTREQTRERLVKEAGDWLFYFVWQAYAVATTIREHFESNKPVIDLVFTTISCRPLNEGSDIYYASGLGREATNKLGWGYLVSLLDHWDISIEEVITANEVKLAERHPNGWQGGKKEV